MVANPIGLAWSEVSSDVSISSSLPFLSGSDSITVIIWLVDVGHKFNKLELTTYPNGDLGISTVIPREGSSGDRQRFGMSLADTASMGWQVAYGNRHGNWNGYCKVSRNRSLR